MEKTVAQNLLLFLNRVDVKGAEVPAWVECHNAVNALLNPAQVAENKEEIGSVA